MFVLVSWWHYHGIPRKEATNIMQVLVNKENELIYNHSKQLLFQFVTP